MRKFLLTPLLFCVSILGSLQSRSQTTLSLGDIAFIGYNADAVYDDFSFILLRDITSGTTIHFTDFGWASDVGGFQKACNISAGALTDGAISWTANSALPAGTQVVLTCKTVLSASVGTVVGLQPTYSTPSDYMSLATGGDQIFAFQGTLQSPTLIAGIQMDGAYIASLGQCQFTASQSTMPPQLGTTYSIAIAPEVDNAIFNCSLLSGPIETLRAAIMNPANWTVNDATPFSLPVACNFNPGTCTAPSISAHPVNRAICTSNNTSYSVTATGTNLTYQWQVNTGSGFNPISDNGTYSGTTSASLSITNVTSALQSYRYRVVVTNSCGNATSNEASLRVSSLNVSTASSSVSCNGGSNGFATLTPSNGLAPYSYLWTPTGSTSQVLTGLAAGSYSGKVTDSAGCVVNKSIIITQPSALVSSVVSNNASCAGSNNGSATVSVSGGSFGYSYSWTPSGGNAATAIGLSAGNYNVFIMDNNGCTKVQPVVIGVSAGTQTGGLAGLPGGSETQTQSVSTSSVFSDNGCNLLTAVQPSGVNPVSGTVTTKVWVEDRIPYVGNSPYVGRHYEITPSINPSTSTGRVTLYFLQSEFDAFNNAMGSVLNLPSSPIDADGKANLRVAKYSGSSSNNSGDPSTYPGPVVLLNPADESIIWNATAGRWEVSFDVNGFSGFIVQTATFTLPVKWTSFTAVKENEKIKLKWITGTELNNSHFVIEHSVDGTNYSAIGEIDAAGNSDNETVYHFTHQYPSPAVNFYRIKQVDVDGKYSYSEVRRINAEARNGLIIVKNPVRNGRLELQTEQDGLARVFNIHGQEKMKINVKRGSSSINLNGLVSGVYVIRVGEESRKFIIE